MISESVMQVERDGQPAALQAHHEFVLFQFRALLVKNAHEASVTDGGA